MKLQIESGVMGTEWVGTELLLSTAYMQPFLSDNVF